MPAVTQVAILFCGQGMSTLIEYYAGGDITAAPDNLVLIDFGGNQRYADEAAAYVVGKLQMQANPKFDLVVISHQDGDHLSLLKNLSAAIGAMSKTVTCGTWYAGGVAWSAANKQAVKDFAAAVGSTDNIEFNAPEESHYSGVTDRSGLGSLCSFGSTNIRVLISGLKLSSGAEDIVRNASSSVIVVENGDSAIVLPGDATYHTMKVVNEFYAGWGAHPLVPPVFTLEIPHHGALRTAVENYTAKTLLAELDFSIITDFAWYLRPSSIVASAGPFNTHHHPVYEVLEVFAAHLIYYGGHTFVSWGFEDPGWHQVAEDTAVLTTVNQIDPDTQWGDQLFTLTDSTSSTAARTEHRFQARGRLSDLTAGARSGPSTPPRRSEAILRAPAPVQSGAAS